MSSAALLPVGFEALEPFVAQWAIGNAQSRCEMRGSSSPEERSAFYNAASVNLAPALAHLDTKAFADYSEQDNRLMHMMLSLAHVGLAEELQGAKYEPVHAAFRAYMPITRAPADL